MASKIDDSSLFPHNQLSEYTINKKSSLRLFHLLNLPQLIESLRDGSCRLAIFTNLEDPKSVPQLVLLYTKGPQKNIKAVIHFKIPGDCFDVTLAEVPPYEGNDAVSLEQEYEIVKSVAVAPKTSTVPKKAYSCRVRTEAGEAMVRKANVFLEYYEAFRKCLQEAVNEQCNAGCAPPFPKLKPLKDSFVEQGSFKVSRERMPFNKEKDPAKAEADDATYTAKFVETKQLVDGSLGTKVFNCSVNYMIDTDKKGNRSIYPWLQMVPGAVYNVVGAARARTSGATGKKKGPAATKKPVVEKKTEPKSGKRQRAPEPEPEQEEEESTETDAAEDMELEPAHGIEEMSDVE